MTETQWPVGAWVFDVDTDTDEGEYTYRDFYRVSAEREDGEQLADYQASVNKKTSAVSFSPCRECILGTDTAPDTADLLRILVAWEQHKGSRRRGCLM